MLRKLSSVSALLSVGCLVLMSPLLLRAYAQETPKPFTLLVAGPTSSIKAGAICEISVTITNISTHQMAIRKDNGGLPGSYYAINIAVDAGHSLTARSPKEVRGVIRSSFQFKRLEPGEVINETLILTDLFDLSKPGVYKIRIRRDVEPEYGGGHVDSNEIAITVVP
jgi:hypothetical protein